MTLLFETEPCEALTSALKRVTINQLFARSVVEKRMPGKIYSDNKDNPSAWYIVHPYGMSLLLGDHTHKDFNQAFKDYALNTYKTRQGHEWMQVFPDAWNGVLEELLQDRLVKSSENIDGQQEGIVELNTRVNFTFNCATYSKLRKNLDLNALQIVRTDRDTFLRMQGSVVPAYFWKDADDFLENGVGFSLYEDGQLTTTAYSAFIFGNELELGIETCEPHRGKGYALLTCARLIDYCLENGFEPVWSCRLENQGSYKLAQKLGFEPCRYLPYYRLSR
jgi:GNAT superfamily N-acetyltransferase